MIHLKIGWHEETLDDIASKLEARMRTAQERYGDFASTHEALGVACEEWAEFQEAIRANDLEAIEHECLDLAAVLIRLARSLRESEQMKARSVK